MPSQPENVVSLPGRPKAKRIPSAASPAHEVTRVDACLPPVNIGAAAQQSGVSAKMLRHYESLGLLGQVNRTDSGYRLYSPADVHTLRFIKRCRDLDFSMAEIGELVSLWQNRKRASSSVKKIAQKHVDDLNGRIAAMQAMQRTLFTLLNCCQGDALPDCPILDDLAGHLPDAT
ncbi:MAG: Cu(I)-responsive transcriptional regulator [Candidatus Saccharibacteria bacterium]|nr:Cu(I)-responsive transcriptional regulator [Rhodoferax sp.]